MKYEKQFRKDNPQTIGETDYAFDLNNYKDWLDEQHSQLLKQNNEMRAFLNKINNDYEAFSDLNSHGYGEELEKLIESTNP